MTFLQRLANAAAVKEVQELAPNFGHVFKDSAASKKAWLTRLRAGNSDRGNVDEGLNLQRYAERETKDVSEQSILSRFTIAEQAEITEKLYEADKAKDSSIEFARGGDPKRGYTKARKELHAKITREILTKEAIRQATPVKGQAPEFVVLGGRGGSGKGSFTNGTINEFDAKRFIKLDSDAIKEALNPPYEGWNAKAVHQESTELFDRISAQAKDMGLNVIHDVTLKTPGKIEGVIKEFRDKKYKVQGHYMFVPPEESARRGVQRYLGKAPNFKRGRLVPVSVLLAMQDNEKSFEQAKGLFDKWSVYDNQGRTPTLISRKGP